MDIGNLLFADAKREIKRERRRERHGRMPAGARSQPGQPAAHIKIIYG